LLVNPGNRARIYQSLGTSLAAVEPPVWALMIAAFVRTRGYSVAILDAEAEGLSGQETAKRAAETDPVLVAVVVYGQQPSASTQNMPAAGDFCAALKEEAPGLKTLLLGGHVAALPERTLREEAADFVAAGEGLYTIVELLQALESGRPKFEEVRGLWYWDGQTPISNSAAPLVVDLNEQIPELPWDLLPMHLYRAHNWHCLDSMERQPYAAIYTTLGCPYHCSFCCIQAPFKSGEDLLGYKPQVNTYRFWSPETVVKGIDRLVNDYGVRNIKFADEMFVLNNRHIEGICNLIIDRNYDLNIWAYARVDTVRPETLEKLKRAGVNWLAFGIESANERVRNEVQKGFGQEQIYKTLQAVSSSGINVIGNYIFGLPEDDFDTMQETLEMALSLNCEFANFYCAMAYPGSPLYTQAQSENWELPSAWSGYSQHSADSLPLRTKYLTAAQVLTFRDQAFDTYFKSPRYLNMIDQRFGSETVQHLKEMALHRLLRDHV